MNAPRKAETVREVAARTDDVPDAPTAAECVGDDGDVGEHLVAGEGAREPVLVLEPGGEQFGHEVVGRVLRAPVDVLAERLGVERRAAVEVHLPAVLGAQRVVDHVADGRLVGLGDAEQHADDAHRQFGADGGDQVEAVGAGEGVQGAGAEVADLRFQHGDPPGGEQPGQQAAVDVLGGRVLEDDGARRDLQAGLDDLQDVAAGGGERPPVRQAALDVGGPADRVEVVLLVVTETSKTRLLLLDIAERLMLEEGYAAVGVRRVAREAGVTPALIHYYFRTLDDLFLAVLRRRAEQEFEAHTRALASDRLLGTLWDYNRIPAGAALTMQFMALANHRKAIRGELTRNAERFRESQTRALAGYLEERGIEPGEVPPAALAVLISMISRTLVLEDALGLTAGHAETLAVIERSLKAIDDRPVREGRDLGGDGAPA